MLLIEPQAALRAWLARGGWGIKASDYFKQWLPTLTSGLTTGSSPHPVRGLWVRVPRGPPVIFQCSGFPVLATRRMARTSSVRLRSRPTKFGDVPSGDRDHADLRAVESPHRVRALDQ